MASLTPDQLAQLRRNACSTDNTISAATKPVLNAALQSIEDWFEANRASLSTAINAATSPITLTAAQKRTLVMYWLRQKFERGG